MLSFGDIPKEKKKVKMIMMNKTEVIRDGRKKDSIFNYRKS